MFLVCANIITNNVINILYIILVQNNFVPNLFFYMYYINKQYKWIPHIRPKSQFLWGISFEIST